MKKSIIVLIAFLVSSSSFAQRHKKLDLVNFIKEAVTFAKGAGFEAACKEFNDGKKFKRGEYYIFAYDYNGKVLCHGGKKALIGKNLLNFKDKKGNELIKDLIKAANSNGGFVKYVWPLPNSEKLADKLGYALPVDKKYWLGSGIYYKKD
jgi:hypothetical protein